MRSSVRAAFAAACLTALAACSADEFVASTTHALRSMCESADNCTVYDENGPVKPVWEQ
ncbi:MAG: hypothetical protein AAF942_11125 [Pseudomonadota bacterium]